MLKRPQKTKPTAKSEANINVSKNTIRIAPMSTLSWMEQESNRPRRPMRKNSDSSTIKTSMKYLTKI